MKVEVKLQVKEVTQIHRVYDHFSKIFSYLAWLLTSDLGGTSTFCFN